MIVLALFVFALIAVFWVDILLCADVQDRGSESEE